MILLSKQDFLCEIIPDIMSSIEQFNGIINDYYQ